MTGSGTKKLKLSSTFEELERLEPFVNELQEWAEFKEDDFNRILLALSEAVNNAIIHGNQQDPEKEVDINTKLETGTLIVSVQDEGDGFDPDSIPDPLKEENLLNEGGRGVYLIEQYADGVKFSKGGTKITITFRLEE